MRLKDLALRAALLPAHHTLQFLDLLARHRQRRVQTRHFMVHHFRLLDAVLVRLVEVILQHMHHRMRHPVDTAVPVQIFSTGSRRWEVIPRSPFMRRERLANARCIKPPTSSLVQALFEGSQPCLLADDVQHRDVIEPDRLIARRLLRQVAPPGWPRLVSKCFLCRLVVLQFMAGRAQIAVATAPHRDACPPALAMRIFRPSSNISFA
jgi:hypothetical protein